MFMTTETAVKITAKLYEARDFARWLAKTPEEYSERISRYQSYIQCSMKAGRRSAIEAAMHIAKGALVCEPVAQAWILAAYVEMVEPSK